MVKVETSCIINTPHLVPVVVGGGGGGGGGGRGRGTIHTYIQEKLKRQAGSNLQDGSGRESDSKPSPYFDFGR